MRKLPLTLAISEYDHVRDLVSGRVVPEGIDLSSLILPVEEIFFRFLRFREWDVSEMSMGRYVSLASHENTSFVGIPVFPSRMFRHSSIFVRRDRAIHEPRDLRGKRIGIPEWAQTAGIYVRGALVHEFGLDLADIEWVQAGIRDHGRVEEVAIALPQGVGLTRVTEDTLNDMLLKGKLDAVISAHPPDCFNGGDPSIKRLFEDFIDVEAAYWRKTGILPIMHVILLRRDIFDRHPWVAMNLFKAFEEAKRRSMQRAAESTASRFPIPWASEYARRAKDIFGEDYWPYGIDANRTTLEAFLDFAFEQGVCRRKVSLDELFPPELQISFKI